MNIAANLPPYPTYSPSGLDWLPEIPAHWRTERGKWLFKKMKRPVRGTDEVVTCFRDGVVSLRRNRRTEGFTESLQEIGYQGIRAGDLVIHAMDAFAGAIGVSDSDGKGTPVYSVCQPAPNANAYYYAHIIREMARSQWIAALATGIRERSTDFRYATLATQRLPLPSLPEQHAIARYLDHVDRHIQRYIDTKEKLIALLQEARQATIHRAVTRGLDPDVPLKPSGVDWLGDVPAHWEVRRLKHLLEDGLTYGANAAAEHENPEWPRYLRITDFGLDGKLRDDTFRSLPPENARDYMVSPGDLLLARSGATVGKAFLVTPEIGLACHAGYLIRARPQSCLLDPKYLFAFTQSSGFTSWKDSVFIIATIQNINAEKYANLPVPTPPIEEQKQIVAYLEKATADIDTSIDTARRQADLMREYRASLIAHVVTGKLDVRAAAEHIGMKTSYQ